MKMPFLSAVLAAGIAVSGVRAEVIEEFQAENWNGIAYADDMFSFFQNCVVSTVTRSGGLLMIIRDVEDGWTIVASQDEWQLEANATYPVLYWIDDHPAAQAPALAYGADQLAITADAQLIDRIRAGRQLSIALSGQDYAFELDNAASAVTAAEACAERHRDKSMAAMAEEEMAEEAEGEVAEAAEPDAPPAEPAAPAETSNASTLGERQEFGHWVVAATDDGAGTFVNCTAFGVYGGDEQLILSFTPQGTWEFGLYRPAWSLPTDGSYFLWYNVDRSVDEAGVMKRPVEAVEPTRIFFEVSGLETLIERAATGQQLNLQLRGPDMEPQDLSYSLDQAGPALEATKACVAQHVAQAETAAAGDVAVQPEASETVQVDPPSPAEAAEGGEPQEETAAGGSLPPLGEDNIESFAVPGWEAGAYADASATFTHCEIAAEYQNGTILGFARTADDSLVMTLHRSDWSLQPGEGSQIKYQVTWETGQNVGITGGGLERYGQAEAIDASTMAIEIGSDERFMERLRQSQKLNIETEGRSLVFNIDDLVPGLDAIDECRQRQLAAAQTAQAEAPQPQQQQAAGAPSLPPIGEEKIETLDVPGWDGGAYADATGAFTHCGISAEYQNGAVLAFARTADNSLLLALARTDWTLEPKEWSPIRYSFGKDYPINNEGEAQAVNATILATNMGRDDLFTGELKQSPKLTVEVQGRTLSFDISDLAPGIDATDACRSRHLAPAAAPSGKAAAAAPPGSDEAAEEGRRYIADILTRAGYGDHHMLVGDAVPDGFEDFDAVWEVGEILGTLRVRPQLEGVELQQVREAIVANDRSLCEGELDSFNLPGGSNFLASMMDLGLLFAVSCKAPDGAYTAVYTVRPRPDGGYYIVTHLGVGDGEAAKAIASAVFEAGP